MTKKTETLGLIILLLLSILVSMGYSVSADIQMNTDQVFNVENENYSFASALTFTQILHNDTWITFNSTGFNVTSTNDINISLSYLNSNIPSASSGDTVLSFSAESSGGLVWFNLSGFDANQSYAVFRDNVKISGLTSNADGNLSFTNTVWSDHDFDIKRGYNYVQVTYGRSALAEITPVSYDALGMIGLIGLVIVGAAIIMYVTRMGSDF